MLEGVWRVCDTIHRIMDMALSRFVKMWFAKKEMRILMVGLMGAGKTTILYKLKLGEIVTTMPTIAFNVETVEYKNSSFTVWDVGGQDQMRPLWRHYFQKTQGLIFVVDSNDRDRITEARDGLHRMILKNPSNGEELGGATILVFANKQDLPNAMSVAEITDKLGLHSLGQRRWYIQSACATSGRGLYEGLDWLSNNITGKGNEAGNTQNQMESRVETTDYQSGQIQEQRPVEVIHQPQPQSNTSGGVLANAAASVASTLESAKRAISRK